MADENNKMALFDEDGHLDFFNSYAIAITTLLMVGMVIYGSQSPLDIETIVAGFVFLPLVILSYILWDRGMIRSNATYFEGAASYVIPQVLLLGIATGITEIIGGRFYSAPTSEGGYLYSLVAQTPPYIQAIFNNNLASFVETFAIFAITYVVLNFMVRADWDQKLPGGAWTVVALGAIPGSTLFGVLHGAIDIVFFTRAFMIMFISILVVFGEALTEKQYFPFAVLVPLAISFHRAINIHEWGGYVEYISTLLTAGGSVEIALAGLVILFDASMVIATAIGLGDIIAKGGGD